MAKASIVLDDTFIFKFPKKDGEISLPECLLEHFLAHTHRIEVANKSIADKYMDWEYRFNPASDPLYLLELRLHFEAKDENIRGGYAWEFSVPADNKLTFSDPIVHDEDEEFHYLSIHIAGEISWDFKPNHFKKINEKMERYCSWEDVAMDVRLTLRENFLWTKGDFPGYKSGMDVPEEEQSADNLPFVLDRMPKSWCVIQHRDPIKDWEVVEKHWTKLEDKNVTYGGKYLSPFNH